MSAMTTSESAQTSDRSRDSEVAPVRVPSDVYLADIRRCRGRRPGSLAGRWLVRMTMAWSLIACVACGDSTPDNPQNAVMEFLSASQVGADHEAQEKLCEELRRDASDEELATLERLTERASVFGEGIARQGNETATVKLRVVFAPSPPGTTGDRWSAHLVKEDSSWRVCGFTPGGW